VWARLTRWFVQRPRVRAWSLPAIIVVVGLVGSACGGAPGASNSALRERIEELESQVEAQDRKIETLTVALTRSRASAFEEPLRRFFDSPEFWENIYVDAGTCHHRCHTDHAEMREACERADDPEDCENRVVDDLTACHQGCPSPGSG